MHPYEAGRQPDELHAEGVIILNAGENFEQALVGLEEGQRIWILFQFHHNKNWNPMVMPPRGVSQKIGVFATRSPYRPNNIGMSTVVIKKIEGLKIFVLGADLLDGSPILDLKPYIAYADSFPEAEPRWLHDMESHSVTFSEQALEQIEFLNSQGVTQLKSFILHQLEFDPINSKKKRVRANPVSENNYTLSYRTWRIHFEYSPQDFKIQILSLGSGYDNDELNSHLPDYSDKYQDKEFHRAFLERFPSTKTMK